MASVQVSSNSSRFGQEVVIRDFHLIADEPSGVGGDNAGPTPVEFVLAGLGSCKAITIKMYAERKGWLVDHISVDVSLQKEGNRQWIQAHLNLVGVLSDKQRNRMLAIADRCPVHKLLASKVEIQTDLAPKFE